MRTDILDRKQEILDWIAENQSKAFMCREIRCKPETLNSYLEKMGIEYAGNQGGKGIKHSPRRLSAEELSTKVYITSHKLKCRMLEDGVREHRCEYCGNSEWEGTDIPLELHHEDGDRFNNSFDNLAIICPNCHTLTKNNSGAGRGSYM